MANYSKGCLENLIFYVYAYIRFGRSAMLI